MRSLCLKEINTNEALRPDVRSQLKGSEMGRPAKVVWGTLFPCFDIHPGGWCLKPGLEAAFKD